MKMESHGIPSKVHVSSAVVQRLERCTKVYNMESRGGEAAVPGQDTTYLVLAASRTQGKNTPPQGAGERKTFQTGGRASAAVNL
jgi:hypothetical protein